MNNLSFDKIKFFKAKEVPKKRTTNNKPPITNERETNIFEKLFKSPFLFLFLFVFVVTYFTSYMPSNFLPPLQVGDLAAFDIVAPADITLEDLEATDENRREDVEAVLPIYALNKSIFSHAEENIRSLFQSGKNLIETPLTEDISQNFSISLMNQYGLELEPADLNALIKTNFPSNLEENLISLIGKISSMGIILTKNLFIRGEQEKGFTLVEEGKPERTLAISLILDIEEAKELLRNEI